MEILWHNHPTTLQTDVEAHGLLQLVAGNIRGLA